MNPPAHLHVRHDLQPVDVDAVIGLHVAVYCEGLGFSDGFAEHVEVPLRAWAAARNDRDRIWLVQRHDELVGCVAVVRADDTTAQLRWFVVHPNDRGRGVGRWLLADAVNFARDAGFASMFLWTVNTLSTAAKLYLDVGFQLTDEAAGGWLPGMTEQRYEMQLA